MRLLVPSCSTLSVFVLSLAALAAPPAPKEAPKPLPPEHVLGLIKALQETMTGQPVVVVGYGRMGAVPQKDELEKAGSMVGKLHLLCEASGAANDPLIPYAVRETWVLAPETRDEVNTDLGHITPTDALARGECMSRAFGSLNQASVAQLGSERGVVLEELPREVHAYFTSAFRPPLTVERQATRTIQLRGEPVIIPEPQVLSHITEPLNPKRVRIRARLRMIGVRFDMDSGSGSVGWGQPEGQITVRAAGDRRQVIEPFELPALTSVPNTYKPSDLDGRGFQSPLGLAGAYHLSDVLDRARAVTGLRLHAGEYGACPVFLGREDLPAGDVLDGVRLALTAAWRKVGDGYVLAWDRRGLGALQQIVADATFAVTQALHSERQDVWAAPGWLALAEYLPFADDDPLALNAGQRREMLDAKVQTGDKAPRIPYAQMTPDQQAALRERTVGQIIRVEDAQTHADSYHVVTSEDLHKAHITNVFDVEVDVEIPGLGWVRSEIRGNAVQGFHLERAKAKAGIEPIPLDPREDERRKTLDSVKPQPMPAAFRALMVPPLSPAEVADVVEKMKRHDLNVLFYPALFGGYATFPTNAFPLHPALREKDGWAAAEAATKAAGIRLIGYMETLAWQRPEHAKSHWLNRHPDWVDVDRTGAPRLDWLMAHPEFDARPLHVGTLANYVRAAVPEVEQRLAALVAAFAAKKGATGLALADWEPGSGNDELTGVLRLPELGFSLPARLAAVQETGRDPIDAPYHTAPSRQPFRPRALSMLGFGMDGPVKSPGAFLAQRLLARARAVRPDWMLSVMDDSTAVYSDGANRKRKRMPVAEVTFTTDYRNGGTPVDDHIERFRPLPPKDGAPKRSDLVYIMANWRLCQNEDARTRGRIVLDLRDAPERLDEVLGWITKGEG